MFGLLIILVASLVLAAWVQSLASQVHFNEEFANGQKHRIAEWNGRALLREYLLDGMANGAIAAIEAPDPLGDGWGGFNITENAPDLLSVTPSTFINAFNPAGGRAFERVVTANVFDGRTDADGDPIPLPWNARISSKSPVFAGYPLTLQAMSVASPSVSGSISVTSGSTTPPPPARLLTWPINAGINPVTAIHQAREKAAGSTTGDLMGFPWIPLTSGSGNGFNGAFVPSPRTSTEIVDDPLSALDGIVFSGTAPIRIMTLNLNNLVSVGATTVMVRLRAPAAAGFTELRVVLTGTLSADLPAIHLIHETAGGELDLTRITLSGANQRRVYLTVSKSSALEIASPALTYRLAMSVFNSPVTFNVAGSLVVRGGFRTSGELLVSSGSVQIQPDPDPDDLEFFADRVFWLEENHAP